MRSLLLKIVAGAFALYTFLGFFLIPYFLQFSIPSYLKKNLEIEVYIDSIHFNPFNYSCKISNFILKDETKQNLVYFENLYVDIDPTALFNNTIYIKKFFLENSKVNINIDKNKIANFQFILEKFASTNANDHIKNEEQKDSSLRFFMEEFDLHFFSVHFQDESKERLFRIEKEPLDLSLKNISLDAGHKNHIDLLVNTKSSGDLHLISEFSFEPLSLSGELKLEDIDISKFFYYLKPTDLQLAVDTTRLNSSLKYNLKIEGTKVEVGLNELVTSVPKSEIKLEEYQFFVDQLALKIKEIIFVKDKEDITYKVDDIQTNINSLSVQDKPFDTKLEFFNIQDSIASFSSDPSKTVHIQKEFQTSKQSKIKLEAFVVQEPLSAKGNYEVQNVDATAYKKYIEAFSNIGLDSAYLNSKGNFGFRTNEDKPFIDITSDISLTNIDIKNLKQQQPFLKVGELKLKDMNYQNEKISIDQVLIAKPHFEFYLNKNKTNNLTGLIKKSKKQELKKEKENTQKKNKEFEYTIAKVLLQDGSAKFVDDTLLERFESFESDVKVEVQNVSSKKDQYSLIKHSSVIDKYGTLKAEGTLIVADPLKDLKVKIDVQNIDIPSLSSYSAKFIGKKIDNGKLYLEFDHTIKDKKLDTKNNLRIKDIELGEEVKSKDAIDAPIGLAIALLEDSSGYIDLDIPIDGDLENPNFHISDVIFDVITNTIVGIVSAPFKFLALLVGGDDSVDLATHHFSYGEATVDATMKEKLDKLILAMSERPGISIKMKPAFIASKDSLALQEKIFAKKYKGILVSKLALSKKLEQLSKVYIEQFSKDSYEKIELEKEEKLQFMLQELKSSIKISNEQLEDLARQRVENIKNYFLSNKIVEDRVKVLDGFVTDKEDTRLKKVIVSFEI